MSAHKGPAYDAIVIGGGVNGCGTARDLALRGLKVALVEKGDFSMGTSWASSGFIHGGIRYLLSDFFTTKKSCLDSGFIRQIAPHLVFRVPLLYPVFADEGFEGRFRLEAANALFSLYDTLQPLKGGKPHSRVDGREVYEIEPHLRPGCIGAVVTDEWGIDVPRLCTLNAVDAARRGADVRSWTKVERVRRDGRRVTGVDVLDTLTGRRETLHADVVVNCAGVWGPALSAGIDCGYKLRPSKGVHLVLDRRISNFGVLCVAVDGREVFVTPHENTSLIGTTDDDYYGDPDHVPVTEDEVAYLLQAIERTLPGAKDARVIKTIAGLRPTLWGWGKYESALSRDHRVYDHAKLHDTEGYVTLTGGKLAAYRIMAEETADLVCKKLGRGGPCTTHETPLPGGESTPDVREIAAAAGIDAYTARRLVYRQGARARDVAARIRRHPAEARALCACDPVTEAEVRFAVDHELVRRPIDLVGRCRLTEGPCQGSGCIREAAAVFAEMRGLDAATTAAETRALLDNKWGWRAPLVDGAHAPGEELYRLYHQAPAAAEDA